MWECKEEYKAHVWVFKIRVLQKVTNVLQIGFLKNLEETKTSLKTLQYQMICHSVCSKQLYINSMFISCELRQHILHSSWNNLAPFWLKG